MRRRLFQRFEQRILRFGPHEVCIRNDIDLALAFEGTDGDVCRQGADFFDREGFRLLVGPYEEIGMIPAFCLAAASAFPAGICGSLRALRALERLGKCEGERLHVGCGWPAEEPCVADTVCQDRALQNRCSTFLMLDLVK